ncbi:MAG: hypothetical protein ACXVGS_16620 [Oryzihumus sp.]
MRRLVAVELRRLRARRLTVIGLIGVVVGLAFMGYGMWDQARPLTTSQRQAATAAYNQARQDWLAHGDQMRTDCLAGQADARKTDPKADFGCDNMEPRLENYGKPRPRLDDLVPSGLEGAAYLVAFVAFVVGAGFTGAEVASGALGTWLTFEPRRLRVLGSKLVAVVSGTAVVGTAAVGLVLTTGWLLVQHYNPGAHTPAGLWSTLSGQSGRAVAVTAAAGLAGAALALLLRHTAAALGVVIGYLVVVEGLLGNRFSGVKPWLLQTNVIGWLEHGTSYGLDVCTVAPDGSYGCQTVRRAITFGHSSLVLAVVLAAALALTVAVFRRRDVA